MGEEATQTGRPPLSKKRKLQFIAIILGCLFVLSEIGSYIVLKILDRSYPMDPMAKITPEKVEGFLARHYDRDLGWAPKHSDPSGEINSLGARNSREFADVAGTISVYGDSYTFCDGVPVGDAWPTLLEDLLGCGVINFGVGGYGTDQALLRMEKMYPAVPSATVLLCIQPENINRIVSIYRGFYQGNFGPPKPYFTVKDGRLEFHQPFGSAETVRHLLLEAPEELIATVRTSDRWYQEMETFGKPWSISFPFSLQLTYRFPFMWNRLSIALTDVPSHAHLYRENGAAMEIMKALVRRFISDAAENSFKSYIVILPPPRDVARFAAKHELNYQPLIDFLHAEKIAFHDMMPTLCREPDLYSLYVNQSGHYSRKGNELIAAELAEFLRLQKAVPTPKPALKSPAE